MRASISWKEIRSCTYTIPRGGWYLVSTPSGKKGYVISTYVSITGYPAQKSDADEEQEVPKADGANGGDNDSEAADIILVPESVASGIVTGQGVNFRNGPCGVLCQHRQAG